MITGNIHHYKASQFENGTLLPYLDLLMTVSDETENGRYDLSDGAYYAVSLSEKSAAEGRTFEAHRRYIDIQCVLSGDERIDCADLSHLSPTTAYNEEKDLAMYAGVGSSLMLRKGDFAVFFPDDAHLPCIGEGKVKKVVIKIPV